MASNWSPRAARRSLLGLLVTAVAVASACDTSTDPFNSGPGRASVLGQVTDAAGAPVINTVVRIACGGAPEVTSPTDAVGVYSVGLSLPARAFEAASGRPVCHFSEPANGIVRAQLDTVLGFARGPVLVVLQRVNLRRS